MYTILSLHNHIYNTMSLNVPQFSIYKITFITQWTLMDKILHLYHHIYHTNTFNIHWFAIYTIIFITQWPLRYTDSPFIPSYL